MNCINCGGKTKVRKEYDKDMGYIYFRQCTICYFWKRFFSVEKRRRDRKYKF